MGNRKLRNRVLTFENFDIKNVDIYVLIRSASSFVTVQFGRELSNAMGADVRNLCWARASSSGVEVMIAKK